MIKPIVRDQKQLRHSCYLVNSGEDVSQIIKDLEDTFATLQGYGLTAPQIGYDKAVAIVRFGKTTINLINPKITSKEGKFIFKGESCFSFPSLYFDTDRYKNISFENGLDLERKSFSSEGIEAIVIQHEIDHLHGILITDRKHKAK